MQAMMSISDVYKERMEAELQDVQEQLRISELQRKHLEAELRDVQERLRFSNQQLRISNQNAERLASELQKTKEQLDAERKQVQEQLAAARRQAVDDYIDAGIRFGAELDALREAVIDKYGIGHAEAVALIEKAQAEKRSLD